MAKDDYEVIACKILVYYYACLKRKIVFDEQALYHAISIENLNKSYFTDVLIMMQSDGLLTGIEFATAWGQENMLMSDLSQVRITSAGIAYIKDNGVYARVIKPIIEKAEPIASLIKLVL